MGNGYTCLIHSFGLYILYTTSWQGWQRGVATLLNFNLVVRQCHDVRCDFFFFKWFVHPLAFWTVGMSKVNPSYWNCRLTCQFCGFQLCEETVEEYVDSEEEDEWRAEPYQGCFLFSLLVWKRGSVGWRILMGMKQAPNFMILPTRTGLGC